MKKNNLIKFKKEPEFAELWDVCLHNLLYNKDKYLKEIISLFKKIGISQESRILDSCAGTGFISLYLRSMDYLVKCMDPMDDEIRVFKEKAKNLNVDNEIFKCSWAGIPSVFKNEKFDFIFCRGNSFIYADGGWNKEKTVNTKSALSSYKKTLKIFYNSLKIGGYLYLDKFPDNETSHKDLVASVQISNKEKENLFFYTRRIKSKRIREAAMIIANKNGQERYVPNVTFDLSGLELEKILYEVGFKSVKKVRFKEEKNFTVWLVQK